mgnify:CR=1 FL=1
MLLGLELLRPFPVFGMGLWKPPWPIQFPSSSSGADVGSTPTAVPQVEESGDQGDGLKPSLITDAEDATQHFQVAGGTSQKVEMDVVVSGPGVKGEGTLDTAEDEVAGGTAGEVSSQAPNLEEDDDAVSSSAESQTGSVRGDGSATGESKGAHVMERIHAMDDRGDSRAVCKGDAAVHQ